MSTQATGEERPLRADARRNRERVLDAASEVLRERGASAQMDEIAAHAGVGVGTVYRHFPNKEALVGALLGRKMLEVAERARSWSGRTGDPWEDFAGFVRDNTEAMSVNAAEQRMLWDYGAAAQEVAPEALAELAAAVAALVEPAHAAGVLRTDFDTWDMPTLMCGLGGSMSHNLPGRNDWRRLREFILDGLRASAR